MEAPYSRDLVDGLRGAVVIADNPRRARAVGESHVVDGKVPLAPVVGRDAPVVARLGHLAVVPLRQREGVRGQILVVRLVADVALEREIQLGHEICPTMSANNFLFGG